MNRSDTLPKPHHIMPAPYRLLLTAYCLLLTAYPSHRPGARFTGKIQDVP